MNAPEPVGRKPGIKRFMTKRFVLSSAVLLIATALCYLGKITGGDWVGAVGLALAGHHAEDWIKAYRGQP